jgi:hypothetical protein
MPMRRGFLAVVFTMVLIAGCSGGGGTGTTKPTAATPTLSPAAGSFASAQSVSLSDSTAGASIYYTTDGTTPSSASTLFKTGTPIAVSATTTIKAIAVASGYLNSAVAPGTYTINLPAAATPTFNPAAGTFTSAQMVSLADTTTGASIYYTTDGSTPSASSTLFFDADCGERDDNDQCDCGGIWIFEQRGWDGHVHDQSAGGGDTDIQSSSRNFHCGAVSEFVGYDDWCCDLLHDGWIDALGEFAIVFGGDSGEHDDDDQCDCDGEWIFEQRGCDGDVHDQFAGGGDAHIFAGAWQLHHDTISGSRRYHDGSSDSLHDGRIDAHGDFDTLLGGDADCGERDDDD